MTEMRDRLVGVEPTLAAAVAKILDAMRALGHPMFVVEGVRSLARQHELYEQGRTRPGCIVTNVDSTNVLACTHSVQADGFGHAVDLAFDDAAPWSPLHPWPLLGAMARTLGVTWGGDWKSMKGDLGHVELMRES